MVPSSNEHKTTKATASLAWSSLVMGQISWPPKILPTGSYVSPPICSTVFHPKHKSPTNITEKWTVDPFARVASFQQCPPVQLPISLAGPAEATASPGNGNQGARYCRRSPRLCQPNGKNILEKNPCTSHPVYTNVIPNSPGSTIRNHGDVRCPAEADLWNMDMDLVHFPHPTLPKNEPSAYHIQQGWSVGPGPLFATAPWGAAMAPPPTATPVSHSLILMDIEDWWTTRLLETYHMMPT